MKFRKLVMPGLACLLLFACDTPPPEPAGRPGAAGRTHIAWDSWGVPHIFTGSEQQFFFADGWAQMHAHANTILKLYGRSRGRGAEYWGEQYLESDELVHLLGHPELAASQWRQQSAESRRILSAFVEGMNAYAAQHPQSVEQANRQVLPLTVTDVNLHGLFVINTRFVGGQDLGLAARWGELGSNTYAIGPARSASGHAMLVQNPHLPWSDEFLFFEKHLQTPQRNIYGVSLVGLPGFAIAFNDALGWSHTNNTIDNADLYELTLDGEGDALGYRLDGQHRAFETNSQTIRVRAADGSFSEREVVSRRSVFGPVIRMGAHKALALRLVGADRPDLVRQWWHMAKADSLEQFEAALAEAQIPFWNVMYADREGNIFYLFNGQVPIRSHGDWAYWQGTVPGDVSGNLWMGVHPYEDLPKVLNPPAGWLQNANDPPWTSTLPMQLDPDDYPPYMAPQGMGFRPQRAVRMMLEDDSVDFEELVGYKLSTRMELADRLLDDLFAAVDAHGSDLARQAMSVLQDWDRAAEADSRGAALFARWAKRLEPEKPGVFARPWDESQPASTPDGLADPAAAVRLLEEAAGEMLQVYGRLDVPWGRVYRIRHKGLDLPGNGGTGSLGIFRVAWPGGAADGVEYIGGGDSWVAVIEFAERPRARVLLSYGNSSQPGSAHDGDQLQLFSSKQLREAWLSAGDLEGRVEKTEWLAAGGFEEE